MCLCVCSVFYALRLLNDLPRAANLRLCCCVLFVPNCLLHVVASYIDAVNKLLIVHFFVNENVFTLYKRLRWGMLNEGGIY